jgi:class 3 adenylate cyclase/pimeloyl-ACP methyl ester carboxylesterase
VLAPPPVRYTHIGDEAIAYRDSGGDGPALMYLGTFGSHQDLMWEEPGYAHFLRSLSELGRLVTFDRRGSGLSSHNTTKPTLEARVADIERVLDTLAIPAAVLIASVGSGQTALAFAAMHPERCRALVLYSPVARTSRAPDYVIGLPPEIVQLAIEGTESLWGTGITASLYAPSLADDAPFVAWAARTERSLATPLEARRWVEMYEEADVRDVLPSVRAPALVVTPLDAEENAVAFSKYVAGNLRDIEHLEIPARDQWPFCDGCPAFLDAVSNFLPRVIDAPANPRSTRRLVAVLFTDLVGSTEQLRSVGDQRWHTALDSHDDQVRRAVTQHGGRVVKSTGDGALSVFDGPASAVEAGLRLLHTLPRIGLSARAGVHVGELEERGDDVAGIAVHVASRIADRAAAGEVLVSTTVRDLVAGSGLSFEDRGTHDLKGLPEPIALLAASG